MAFDIAPYGAAIAEGSKLLNGILTRVLPEKVSEETALKLEHELTLALINGELQPMLAQLNVNAEEAKSDKMFVAGWRPFVGWVCGVALGWQFIGLQIALFVVRLAKLDIGPLPVFDYASLSPILLGMLGLGGLRTYEKVKGVANVGTGK